MVTVGVAKVIGIIREFWHRVRGHDVHREYYPYSTRPVLTYEQTIWTCDTCYLWPGAVWTWRWVKWPK